MAAFGLSFEQKSKKLKILDEPAKPFEHLKWVNGRTPDLATYMKEHPYMYAGDNVRAVFRVCRAMIGDVIDLFGTEVTFSDEDGACGKRSKTLWKRRWRNIIDGGLCNEVLHTGWQ